MLTVTEPAGDRTLLTPAELADAIGVDAGWPLLGPLNERIAALMATACGLSRAGTAPLTLRAESYTETTRLRCATDIMFLSRKPVTEVFSVTYDGTVLHEDYDFERRDERSLVRLNDTGTTDWQSGRYVIAYRAGWETVPADLKLLASKLAVTIHAERQRDPSLKRVSIPGLSEREYWVGSKDDPLITAEIEQGLRAGGYMMQEMIY